MEFIDISNPAAINAAFKAYALEGFGAENAEVELFGRMFWRDLTAENRKLYHWVWPPRRPTRVDEAAHYWEGRILARQEEMDW